MEKVSTRFYWKGIYSDVEDWVSQQCIITSNVKYYMNIQTQIFGKYLSSDLSSPSTLLVLQVKRCDVCQRSKRKFDKPAPSLHPIPVSDTWCKVGIDLIELPLSSRVDFAL